MTVTPRYLYLHDGCICNAVVPPPEGTPYLPLVELEADEGRLLTDGTYLRSAVTVNAPDQDRWTEVTP